MGHVQRHLIISVETIAGRDSSWKQKLIELAMTAGRSSALDISLRYQSAGNYFMCLQFEWVTASMLRLLLLLAISMPDCCTFRQVTISLHPRIASKWGLLGRLRPDCPRFQSLLSLYSVPKCFIFLWHWSTDFFIFCLSLSILVSFSQALRLSLLSNFLIFSPHNCTSTCSSLRFHRLRVFFLAGAFEVLASDSMLNCCA